MSQQQQDVQFEKKLSPLGVWGLAIGAMIGWGCFVMPGDQLLPDAGPIGATLGLILGACMIVIISFSYSYLISKYPVSGGEFVYADTAFGKTHAFLCGWFISIAYWALIPMNGTAVGLVARYLVPGPLQAVKLYEIAGWPVYLGELIVCIAAIVIIGVVNMRGVEAAGWFQTAVAVGLVGSMLVIAAAVLMGGPDWSNLKPFFAPEKSALSSVFTIAALAPWAFVGFDCIPQASEEYSFSNKKTKALLISSISVAALMYMIANTATAIVEPWELFIAENSSWPTGAAIEQLIRYHRPHPSGHRHALRHRIRAQRVLSRRQPSALFHGHRRSHPSTIRQARSEVQSPTLRHHVHDDPCHHRAILWPPRCSAGSLT